MVISILTPQDVNIIPEYVRIFNEVLDRIKSFYSPEEIEKTRKLYTEQYIAENLTPNPKVRFIAHFGDSSSNQESLDGLLIEGFDSRPLPRTLINWVMAYASGKGIGTQLIEDCVRRAWEENKDSVAFVVSTRNESAIRLYNRLGFEIADTIEGMPPKYFMGKGNPHIRA